MLLTDFYGGRGFEPYDFEEFESGKTKGKS